MKMRKTVKRTLAFVTAIVLTASMAVVRVSAEEIQDDVLLEDTSQEEEEDSFQEDTSQDDIQEEWQEPETKVSGVRETLNLSEYIRNMDWGYFSEAPDSGSWIGRMGLPDFAVNLYNTLAAGADNDGVDDILIEDSVFTEEQALTVNYSNGKKDVFNAIEVLNVTYDARMADEEWDAVRENICQAYYAFLLDYPRVFWLKDSLKVTRVLTEETDETGVTYYNYKVYLLLKNYGRKYDIRGKKYQSAEAIRAVVAEREASVQEVLAGVSGGNTADTIAYFKDNIKVVAKNIGTSTDNVARALKILCNDAGIPCVLASGSGGGLEAYMLVDGAWLTTDQVDQKIADEKKAAEQKKAEVGKEQDKKEEESKKAAAQPAVRSARTMTVADAASNPTARASTDGQFYIDGSPANEEAVLQKVVSLQTDANGDTYDVFGNSWQKILKVESGFDTGVEYQPAGQNKVKVAFQLQRLGDSWYPSAGQNRDYSLSFSSSDGQVKGTILGKQDIKQRELTITKGNLSYQRIYRTETFELMPNVSANIGNPAPSAVPESERTVTAEPTVIEDENVTNTDEIGLLNGYINVKVTLKGSGASNYVIAGTGGQNTTDLSGIPYSCRAQKLETDILEVQLEPNEYTYDGNKKEPKVIVSINGELMSASSDYSVTYGGDPVNATVPESIAFVQVFPVSNPRKYDWKDVEVKRTYNILKSDWDKSETNVSDTIRYGKTKEIDLSEYMPSDASIQSAVILDSNIIQDASPAASNSATLRYEVRDDSKLINSEGKINVSIGGSRNYSDYAILVTVKVLDKLDQEDFRFQQEVMKLPKKGTVSVAAEAVEGSTVTYESSDSSIVDVKNDGTIRGVSEGEATITAKATAIGDYKAKTIRCKVKVVPQKNTITTSAAVEQGEYQYKLEIEKGISQKPANLSMELADIETRLKEEILALDSGIPQENIQVYDVTLLRRFIDLEDAEASRSYDWEVVDTDDEFPTGIAVIMPYPEGRGGDKAAKTAFAVSHMFTENINDKTPGDVECWSDDDIDKTNDGLQFTVTGLSPIAVGWGPIRNEQDQFKFEYDVMKVVELDEISLTLEAAAGSTVTYESADPSIADVDFDGTEATLYAMSQGRTIITATATGTDDYKPKTVQCEIIVIPQDSVVEFTPYEFSKGSETYKLEIERGLSIYPTESLEKDSTEIDEELRAKILSLRPTIPAENIEVYDITLYRKADSHDWVAVDDKENFPKGGVTITVPYPEGRDETNSAFAIAHMYAEKAIGVKPGKVESWDDAKIKKTDDGLQVTVKGLSPVAVGWEEVIPAPDDPTNPDDPDNPNNPNNPTDPSNPNNNNTNNPNGTNGTGTGTTGRTATSGSSGATSGTTSTAKGAATGDTNQVVLYIVLFAAAAAVLGIVFAVRKKHK